MRPPFVQSQKNELTPVIRSGLLYTTGRGRNLWKDHRESMMPRSDSCFRGAAVWFLRTETIRESMAPRTPREHQGSLMASPYRKIVFVVLFALMIFVVLGFAWPLVNIQLRLWRNGKIAQGLAQSLEARYPGIGFRGAASYKDEVVYVVVVNRLNPEDLDEVETWLRKAKREQKIAPTDPASVRR